ncbi:hypothetical protein J2Z32_000053 [Paenibacillus turicensis]|uniref:Pilus assembly protein TadE n=2 Tax=Paenibacillus turicensis TaxID=160487 RepID=A0ABS4FLI7_9BACL|nr:hypothetical protein [Paenibacillus turicensis]
MKLFRNKGNMRDIRGSFTLEASLVLPVIFIAILLLLFFCLYLYQNAFLAHSAAIAADRASYVWDNSFRDPKTGAVISSKADSLYWRLTSDTMLQSIFLLGSSGTSGEAASTLQLPSTEAEVSSDNSLPLQKLKRVASQLPTGFRGEMSYQNKLLVRKIDVTLQRLVSLTPLDKIIGDSTQIGYASSYIVEPVEFIRTVELGRYYGAKFKAKSTSPIHVKQVEAGAALRLFGK